MRSVALAGTTATREELAAVGADLILDSFEDVRMR